MPKNVNIMFFNEAKPFLLATNIAIVKIEKIKSGFELGKYTALIKNRKFDKAKIIVKNKNIIKMLDITNFKNFPPTYSEISIIS